MKEAYLELPALAFQQGKDRTLFTFAVEGATLKKFAAVAHISRQKNNVVNGYQRPEVLSHIANITKYLSSTGAMLPNAIVVAFDATVQFIPLDKKISAGSRTGILRIPLITTGSGKPLPAWIVDGQQRAAALEQIDVADFMVCIVGFTAGSTEEQREQFMLVNSTKPLSKSLLYELLPQTHCALPGALEKKRLPTLLLSLLNGNIESPFYQKIKTATNPVGIIQDNSVLRMIENSLADGILYVINQNRDQTEDGIPAMLHVLNVFWRAVSLTFPSAWQLVPSKSRLTHGAGIISMGFIMDAITSRNNYDISLSLTAFQTDLEQLAPTCRWTHGYWEFGPSDQRKWNHVQNTPTDIRVLSEHLLFHYKSLVWSNALRAT